MNKNFGAGISDFREFREKECFYIDKSLYIKEILNENSKTILITRPRRFGKSLNMSMLYHFFNMNEDSKDIFDGLKIMKEENNCLSEMNNYPVIRLSFNGIAADNYEKYDGKNKNKNKYSF